MDLRIERSEELDERIENSGLTLMTYDAQWKVYRVKVVPSDLGTNHDVLRELVQSAKGLPVDASHTVSVVDTSTVPVVDASA